MKFKSFTNDTLKSLNGRTIFGPETTLRNSGTSEGVKKGWEKRKVGEWVVHPISGGRGMIDHVYDNIPATEKGRLVRVDYGSVPHGNDLLSWHVNHREGDVKLSADQKSKWAEKRFESKS